MKFSAFLIACVLVFSACSDDATEEPSDSIITGIVTEVNSQGLNQVSSFTIKEGDRIEEILIDESADYGFPLGHLEEHRVSSAPVEVEVEERDGELYALSIVDAEES